MSVHDQVAIPTAAPARPRRGAPVLLAVATAVGLWFGFAAEEVTPLPAPSPVVASATTEGATAGGGVVASASSLAAGAIAGVGQVLSFFDLGARPAEGGRARREGRR